jgi:hypothetical protein
MYDQLPTPPTEEELDIGPSRFEAVEAELKQVKQQLAELWWPKTSSAGAATAATAAPATRGHGRI